jgi:hypothetical protein
VTNQSGVPVLVQVNTHTRPGVLQPGEQGRFHTSVNEHLRKITVTNASDPSDSISQEFQRDRGYFVDVVVSGPPLTWEIKTKSF